MNEMKCWLACGSDGQLRAFSNKPERNGMGEWRGNKSIFASVALFQLEQCGMQLPMLKHSDDPVELTITLSYETSEKE